MYAIRLQLSSMNLDRQVSFIIGRDHSVTECMTLTTDAPFCSVFLLFSSSGLAHAVADQRLDLISNVTITTITTTKFS